MAELTLALLIRAEAAQAKGEIGTTAAEVRRLTGATQEGGAATQDAAEAAAEFAREAQRLRLGLAAGSEMLDDGQAQLRQLAEQSRAAGVEQRQLGVDVAALRGEVAGLAAVEGAAQGASAASAAAIDEVAASLAPAALAQRRYEAQVEAATRAVRLGAATQAEANRVTALARGQLLGLDAAAGAASGASAQLARNLAFQVNQIAQMGAVTGNYLGALAVQLPDIFAGFGGLPMILAGGALAIGASFIPALFAARDAAEEAEAGLDDFTAALDRYRSYAEIASSTTAELRAQFGRFAEEMRADAQWVSRVALGGALAGFEGTELMGGLRPALADLEEVKAARQEIADFVTEREGPEAWAEMQGLGVIDLAAHEALLTAPGLTGFLARVQIDAQASAAALGLTLEQVEALGAAWDRLRGSLAQGDLAAAQAEADALLEVLAAAHVVGAPGAQAIGEAGMALFDLLGELREALATQEEVAAAAEAGVAAVGETASEAARRVLDLATAGDEFHRMAAQARALGDSATAHELAAGADRADESLVAWAARIGEATAELDELQATLDSVIEAAARTDDTTLDGMAAAAGHLKTLLEEARRNIETLDQASLDRLTGAVGAVAGIVDRILGGLGQLRGELETPWPTPDAAVAGTLVDRIIQVESAGDPTARNPDSTATGLGQFIESTWLGLFREHFPDRAQSMTDAAILALREDAQVSRAMVELYIRENAAVLQAAGVAITDAHLYLAHFLGAQDAIDVIRNPGAPVGETVAAGSIAANASILGGGRTGAEVIAWARRKVGVSEAELGLLEGVGRADAAAAAAAEREHNAALRDREAILAALTGPQERYEAAVARAQELRAQELLTEPQLTAEIARQAEIRDQALARAAAQSEAARKAEAQAVEAARAAYDGLVGSMDPVIAAQAALAAGQDVVADALARGAITAAEAEAANALLAERLRQTTAELAAQDPALLAAQDRLGAIAGFGREVFGGILADARAGADGVEILLNALDRLADRLAEMALDTLFGAGEGDYGLFGDLLGAALGVAAPAPALSAPVAAALDAILAADGHAFAAGRVLPFAKGGLPSLGDFSGSVVDRPTLFGLMGEAGPEAILPLAGGGVGAILGGEETTLPLARLSDGRLGVRLFADGGVVGAPAAWRAAALDARGGAAGPERAGAGGAIDMTVTLDPGLRAAIVAEAGQLAVRIVEQRFDVYDRNLKERVRDVTRDPSYRGR
jgi:hypothetical protein